jgi:hypothetical protein
MNLIKFNNYNIIILYDYMIIFIILLLYLYYINHIYNFVQLE